MVFLVRAICNDNFIPALFSGNSQEDMGGLRARYSASKQKVASLVAGGIFQAGGFFLLTGVVLLCILLSAYISPLLPTILLTALLLIVNRSISKRLSLSSLRGTSARYSSSSPSYIDRGR
jgi:hypothetical protein